MPQLRTRLAALLMVCAACAVAAATAEACPMCKVALGTDRNRLVHAWGLSIVFMLSMPILIFTTLAVKMYLLVRRARMELEAREAVDKGPSSTPDELSPVPASAEELGTWNQESGT